MGSIRTVTALATIEGLELEPVRHFVVHAGDLTYVQNRFNGETTPLNISIRLGGSNIYQDL